MARRGRLVKNVIRDLVDGESLKMAGPDGTGVLITHRGSELILDITAGEFTVATATFPWECCVLDENGAVIVGRMETEIRLSERLQGVGTRVQAHRGGQTGRRTRRLKPPPMDK